MTLTTQELKDKAKKLFEDFSAPDYKGGPTTADVRMTGPQSSEAVWPKFKLVSDEPRTIAGTDTAPAPSSIFVASIGFAENVIFARQAALNGVDFDSYETHLEAQWNRKGVFGIGETDPRITELLIETRVGSKSPAEKVAEMLRLTHERSPMTRTVAKSARITRKLFVNGEEVNL